MKVYQVEVDDSFRKLLKPWQSHTPRDFQKDTLRQVFGDLEKAQQAAEQVFGRTMFWSGPYETNGSRYWGGMVPNVTGTMSATIFEIEVTE